MAIIAAGGAVATRLGAITGLPRWSPLVAAFGSAVIAVWYTHRCQPRKIEELRATIIPALLLVPLVAAVVWMLLGTVPR